MEQKNYKSVYQITRLGRNGLILEFNDKLKFNDFKNIQISNIHDKFSRIEMICVDSRNNNTNIFKFNFAPKEIKLLLELIDFEKPENFITKCSNIFGKPHFELIKINIYKKDEKGQSPGTKIILSYQNAMKSLSKWKLQIEEGLGFAEQQDNGLYNFKTFTKIKETTVYLTTLELFNTLKEINDYILAFEISQLNKVLKAREEYIKNYIEKK